MQRYTEVTCTQCGWVHIGFTREQFGTSTPRETCFRCGASNTLMRLAREGDAPRGCTLQSILLPEHLCS